MDQDIWTTIQPNGWPANCQIAARYFHDWGDLYLWEVFLELEGHAYLLTPVNSATPSELQQLWSERIFNPDTLKHWSPNDFQPIADALHALKAAHIPVSAKRLDMHGPHLEHVA